MDIRLPTAWNPKFGLVAKLVAQQTLNYFSI